LRRTDCFERIFFVGYRVVRELALRGSSSSSERMFFRRMTADTASKLATAVGCATTSIRSAAGAMLFQHWEAAAGYFSARRDRRFVTERACFIGICYGSVLGAGQAMEDLRMAVAPAISIVVATRGDGAKRGRLT